MYVSTAYLIEQLPCLFVLFDLISRGIKSSKYLTILIFTHAILVSVSNVGYNILLLWFNLYMIRCLFWLDHLEDVVLSDNGSETELSSVQVVRVVNHHQSSRLLPRLCPRHNQHLQFQIERKSMLKPTDSCIAYAVEAKSE